LAIARCISSEASSAGLLANIAQERVQDMNLYTFILFAHVCGAIGIFFGLGAWVFGVGAIRQAQRVEQVRLLLNVINASGRLVVGGILVLGVAGFYMAATVWGIKASWIIVATISFLLLVPLSLLLIEPRLRALEKVAHAAHDGPLPEAMATHTRDPLFATGLGAYIACLFGIVFLMTNKPDTEVAVVAMVIAVAVGLVASLPLWWISARERAARQVIP
jgi:hypothetical protein